MTKTILKQYSVSLTILFAEVLSLQESQLEIVAKRALQRFSGYGLRHVDLCRREGDGLFDYELTFSFINQNVSFRMNAEAAYMAVQNARDEKDAGIITDCFVGALDSLAERRVRESRLEAFVHVSLNSADERENFLSGLGPSDRKELTRGTILYSPADEYFREGRFLADRSLMFPDGVFLTWAAPFGKKLNADVLNKAAATFRRLTNSIGLEF